MAMTKATCSALVGTQRGKRLGRVTRRKCRRQLGNWGKTAHSSRVGTVKLERDIPQPGLVLCRNQRHPKPMKTL